MATIELDIIKQRSDKLLTKEKIELINYLTASLTLEEIGKLKKKSGFAKSTPTKAAKKKAR